MIQAGAGLRWPLMGMVLSLLLACGGQYSGAVIGAQDAPSSTPTPEPSPGPEPAPDEESFFKERVQPRLDFCRTCHVPEGVADVPEGDDFLLDPDPAQDAQRLQESWQGLGGNNPISRLLTMASGAEEHSGGAPWPTDSQAYADVQAQLRCYADPDNCADYIAQANAHNASEQAQAKAQLWQQATQWWLGLRGPGCMACHGAPQARSVAAIRQPQWACGQQHAALVLPLMAADLCELLGSWVQP